MTSPVRIAIISTPRSGNTWLRKLLAQLYNVPEVAVHSMADDDWSRLPENCLFQMHVRHDEAIAARLREHGFRVVTLVRHPLDVLLSILHFALYEPQVERWLEGESGSEKSILLVSPNSASFTRYAVGPRARTLLSVSAGWWNRPGCVNLRYEDLVESTAEQLKRIVAELGWTPSGKSIEQAVADNSMKALRNTANNNHFWKGQPGSWSRFITASVAREIASKHADLFQLFSYDCRPDERLTAEQANQTWLDQIQEEWWQFLNKLQRTREELAHKQAEVDQLLRQLQARLAAAQPAPVVDPAPRPFLRRVVRRLFRAA